MAIVEEVADDETDVPQGEENPLVAASKVEELAARLTPPNELLPQFLNEAKPEESLQIYRSTSERILETLKANLVSPEFASLPLETQSSIILPVLRLSQPSPYTSPDILTAVSGITSSLPSASDVAVYILSNVLKPLFRPSAHPMLNPSTSRALSRPAGGQQAFSDFSESSTQIFKSPQGWACDHVLAWCCDQLDPGQVERHIGLILPPSLVMMDDWEPPWRGRGITVLSKWVEKIDTVVLKRMGLDKLLLDSLIHTLSLHPNPPLPQALPAALSLIERTMSGQAMADRLAEIMDKAVLQGWMYAPSGNDGRAVLIHIAGMAETLCGVFGIGIARWLKTIIPNLLDPLQYTPTTAVLPHHQANLSALLCTMKTLRGTERIARWRGKILDVLSRLWLNLADRGSLLPESSWHTETEAEEPIKQVRILVVAVIKELADQCPSVKKNEFQTLLDLDKTVFATLIPAQP
ncbi:hypothetical protein BCR39DRAFT_548038 [Naematelia encephala]|uniref:Uncharacterized protein n=1 Tax=Naematelia encephala TaxID=71784 RepID=A0A1Y2APE2_9TREE|nr:hypothetical protein BCR39DRAFT_548038 [Naematelia encephala]